MDNIIYHGTSKEKAPDIVKSVDLNLGRGELGRGFYTGTSIAMAKVWATHRFPKSYAVVKFEISEQKFLLLDGHLIRTKTRVKKIWDDLREKNITDTYLFGKDYVMAPFATSDIGHQIKFESQKAANELNDSKKTIY